MGGLDHRHLKDVQMHQHRPGQSPVVSQGFPQLLFLIGQMLLKQRNSARGHSWTEHGRSQRRPPRGFHHLRQRVKPQSVSHGGGRRKEQAQSKVPHQVQRHKDGMQELWCVGLRDERLQTGLKKASSESRLGPLIHPSRKHQAQLTRRQREYLIFWKRSKNSSSGGGQAFPAKRLSAHEKRSQRPDALMMALVCSTSRHLQPFASFDSKLSLVSPHFPQKQPALMRMLFPTGSYKQNLSDQGSALSNKWVHLCSTCTHSHLCQHTHETGKRPAQQHKHTAEPPRLNQRRCPPLTDKNSFEFVFGSLSPPGSSFLLRFLLLFLAF